MKSNTPYKATPMKACSPYGEGRKSTGEYSQMSLQISGRPTTKPKASTMTKAAPLFGKSRPA